REVKPDLVEKIAELVRARHPDHHRRGVGHTAKACLAFPQRVLAPLAFGDVEGHAAQEQWLAIPSVLHLAATRDPTRRAPGQRQAIFYFVIAGTLQGTQHRTLHLLAIVRMDSLDDFFKSDGLIGRELEQAEPLFRAPELIARD